MKINKRTFIIALVFMFFQIALAHKAIIKPISMSSNLTLFYSVVLASIVIFPITLSVIFAYILKSFKFSAKRFDRKFFLVVFLLCSWFLSLMCVLESVSWDWHGWHAYFFRFFPWHLGGLVVILGVPLGLPLAYFLGWQGWNGLTVLVLVGIFSFSAIFALIYSLFSFLAIKREKIYKRAFVLLVIFVLIAIFLATAHKAYVRTLSDKGECTYGLNMFACDEFKDSGEDYFSFENNVYYLDLSHQLTFDEVKEFEVFHDSNKGFAVIDSIPYYKGKVIPSTNVEAWSIIDNEKYYAHENLHSADGENVFFVDRVLEYADPESTVVFSRDYACNDQYVYHGGKIIPGADVDTFADTGCGGTTRDKNFYYLYGDRIMDVQDLYGNTDCYLDIRGTCKEARMPSTTISH